MNLVRVVLIAAATSFCAMPGQSQARPITAPTYQELLEKSDLVVIAIPKSKTADAMEEAFLPNISQQDNDGKQSRIKSLGVETVFAVSVVLKGDKSAKQFTLHHYREAQTPSVEVDGPSLVFFDPVDSSQRSSYMLFLVREPDGRFAPTGGQTDPGYKSINRLPFEPK